MTDLTPQELMGTITRSLSETWQRMAEKYKGVAPDQPAPAGREHEPETFGEGRRG